MGVHTSVVCLCAGKVIFFPHKFSRLNTHAELMKCMEALLYRVLAAPGPDLNRRMLSSRRMIQLD